MFRNIPLQAFGTKPVVRLRDIEAVVHNYRQFQLVANKTNSLCAATVKGELHGLQMKDACPKLFEEGCRHFFVSELVEGVQLRSILPQKEVHIYTLGGLLAGEEAPFQDYHLTPCLNNLEQLIRWNAYCQIHGTSDAVIHFDTGMNRLRLLDDEVSRLAENFETLTSHLNVVLYMSHFYDIKGKDHTNCHQQLKKMEHYTKQLPKRPISFSATDSTILLDNEKTNFQMIRPGIGLVGGGPNAETLISSESKHAIEIYTKISQIKMIPSGQSVGYKSSYKTKRDTKIALAHIGYKDGYLRHLSGADKAFMAIGTYKVPILGKISFCCTTLDITDVPDKVLEEYGYVEVVGPNVDLRALADIGGCYEIMAALGRPNYKISDYTMKEFKERFENPTDKNEKIASPVPLTLQSMSQN